MVVACTSVIAPLRPISTRQAIVAYDSYRLRRSVLALCFGCIKTTYGPFYKGQRLKNHYLT